jgi:hypothetical protein
MSQKLQITLSDRQYDFLVDESERTGLSMAELLRRAMDLVYRPHNRPRVRGVEVSVSVVRRPDAAMIGRRSHRRRRRRGGRPRLEPD